MIKPFIAYCALFGGLFFGCQAQLEDIPPLREQSVSSLSLMTEDSTIIDYDLGSIKVPMNRQNPSEQLWDVEFVRFKRTEAASPETPPIFILRGGPGSASATELLEDPGYYDYFIAPYVGITDVIIPGQRGLRTSGATPCDPMRSLSIDEVLDKEAFRAEQKRALDACRAKWEAQGVELQGFNVKEMAADVHDIARGLGYDTIQLIGQSFGSHWGLATLRDYPALISRATLSGLEGPDHTYDMPGHVVSTLMRIAESAEASPELAPLIPEEGLLAAYQNLIHQVSQTPIPVAVTHPETDQEITIHLDDDALKSFTGGYSRGTTWRFIMPSWPIDVLTLLNGDFNNAAQEYVEELLDTRLRDAAYYQIECASGISNERGTALRSDPAMGLIGQTWAYYDNICESWEADLGEDFRDAFTSDIPVLLLQGNWDTSTPYENVLEVRAFFRNHHFIHIEGGSHGAFREANEEIDGFRDLVYEWLATGRFDHLPENVTLPPIQWRSPDN